MYTCTYIHAHTYSIFTTQRRLRTDRRAPVNFFYFFYFFLQHLHYAEASSYGSQSASSFAALYSKYVTDDVTVAVRCCRMCSLAIECVLLR